MLQFNCADLMGRFTMNISNKNTAHRFNIIIIVILLLMLLLLDKFFYSEYNKIEGEKHFFMSKGNGLFIIILQNVGLYIDYDVIGTNQKIRHFAKLKTSLTLHKMTKSIFILISLFRATTKFTTARSRSIG